jgi:hypothetical protein
LRVLIEPMPGGGIFLRVSRLAPMSDTARGLVELLVDAGDWPEPELLEAIVAEGDAAVEPLLEIVRRDLAARKESTALYYAPRLLAIVGARGAIPDLLTLYRTFDDDILDDATQALASCGAEVIEPSLAIAADRSLGWYPRSMAITAARGATGDDLIGRQRVAEVLRDILSDCLARAEEIDEDMIELASSVVCDLAELADPLARDLIEQAFQAGLVDEFTTDRADVRGLYEQGGQPLELPDPKRWLDRYREQLAEHLEWEKRYAEEYASFPVRSSEPPDLGDREDGVPLPPPVEPIRYTQSRPGRNDPCWCGSGKKYKKCHLRADEATPRSQG